MPKTNKKPTVIITGAGGYLGSALVQHLVDQGWRVIGLVRHAERYKTPGVTYKEYDLAKSFDDALFKGADYLVHTAYVKYDRQHQDALDVNVSGAERLVAASRKHGLKHNVFMSTMSAHDGGTSVYAQQKLRIEELFHTKRDTVLRAGLIIGDGGIVKQMAGFMKTKRLVPLVGGGKQPLQIIAVYDLVQLIADVLQAGLSGTYTVAHPTVYQYKDFYSLLGERLGVKPLFLPVPFFAIQSLLRVADLARVSLSISEDNLNGLKHLIAVDNIHDLEVLRVTLDDLPTALSKTESIAS
jgi:nucleoside-diphosphate-sugar epimerase